VKFLATQSLKCKSHICVLIIPRHERGVRENDNERTLETKNLFYCEYFLQIFEHYDLNDNENQGASIKWDIILPAYIIAGIFVYHSHDKIRPDDRHADLKQQECK